MINKRAALGLLLILVLAAVVAGRYSNRSGSDSHTASRRMLSYRDRMHPAFRSSKPGIAPDCGMALEPVYEGDNPEARLQLAEGAVSSSPKKQQLIGVRVEAVQGSSGSRLIRTIGRVEANQNRVYRLTASTEGWVQSLENNPDGTIVKKNDVLAQLYSRQFRNDQQSYLGSLASVDRLRAGRETEEQGRTSDANLRLNEEQLRALGMGEPQLRELAKNRQTTRDIALVSPIDGVVLARNISPDQRFEKGAELYSIADLSKVWILADLYGDEVKSLRPGMRVKVHVRELDKTLYATVSANPPLFDPASRTLKVRLDTDNPGSVLRPDMFVDLEFTTKSASGLSIPQEAVIDSGLQKVVYVETSEGVFEPRTVEIGTAFGDRVTVLRDLAEGDRVVTAGNFLIDSESRMRSTAQAVPSLEQHQSQHSKKQARYAGAKPGSTAALHESRGADD